MRRKLFIFIVLSVFSAASHAVRCGNSLVLIGDHEQVVLEKCGQPLSHEQIGYIDQQQRGERITVLKIEESIYRLRGELYQFRFEGNKLTNIKRSQ